LGDHLVLVGLMGTGKTTVGRELARRLGRPLIDSDEQVEARTGRTVREIWRTDGEPAFRVLEAEALAEALASDDPAVIAAAGGVVLAAENRRRLVRAGTVVWLRGDPAVLAERARRADHRPLLDRDPRAALEAMARDRVPLYEEVADHTVDVTDRTPDQVADRIMELTGR
jgi:shikimate kinase